MMLYILFYFIRDHRQGISLLRSLVPLSNHETDEVFARVEDTINATITGRSSSAGARTRRLGTLPASRPARAVAVGSAHGRAGDRAGTGTVHRMDTGRAHSGSTGSLHQSGLITVGGIAIGLIGHFLYPILVGHKLRLHPVLVFFAFLGGLTVFGIAGLILGPAVLALTEALVNVWQRRTADGRPAERRVESHPRSARP